MKKSFSEETFPSKSFSEETFPSKSFFQGKKFFQKLFSQTKATAPRPAPPDGGSDDEGEETFSERKFLYDNGKVFPLDDLRTFEGDPVKVSPKGVVIHYGKQPEPFDSVSRPEHYCNGKIECIDAMIQTFGIEAVRTFCIINAFKYRWRAPFKGKQSEDISKAEWYLAKAAELNQRKQ